MLELHDHAPGLRHLVRVARAQDDEARDGAQGEDLLDGLMGRSVFAHADGVVGEDVDDRDLHDRGQADRRPPVVAEDQEA